MFVARDGAQIAYGDTGAPVARPDAPTIVFGHGLLMSGWQFHPQVEALRRDYRCVTIDWRGQGASDGVRRGFDPGDLALDVVDLVGHLGGAPVHFVGVGQGGVVGIRLAVLHPEVLRSLTLVDTTAGAEDPQVARGYARLSRILLVVGVRRLYRRVVPILFGVDFLASQRGEALIEEWGRRLAAQSRRGLRLAVLGTIRRASSEADASRIRVPTFIAAGADDLATPLPNARRLGELIPGSRVRVVPAAAHVSTLEQPDIITALIAEHVAAH